MKVVMTLLVRDEEDILREHLDFHYAMGVDEVILMDNLSTDATARIAREYERAGRLRYIFQERDDYDQGAWVTAMARMAADDHGADWVINSDADEFWYPATGSIKDALASLPAGAAAAAAPRTNFVPSGTPSGPFWRHMDVRYAKSYSAVGRPLYDKVAHRGRADVVVEQGNHRIFRSGEPVEAVPAPITILHFPIRTREQFANKIVKGGSAYLRNTRLPEGTGETWIALYRLYLIGRLDEAFDEEALSDERIARGLRDGTLVRDRRLIRALEEIRETCAATPR